MTPELQLLLIVALWLLGWRGLAQLKKLSDRTHQDSQIRSLYPPRSQSEPEGARILPFRRPES